MKTLLVLCALALGAASGCADDFDEYTLVSGLRVLGVRATPPDVMPESTATLDALVTADASYQWSWCPLPYGGLLLDECPISEAELAELIAASGSSAEPPPYDLGVESSAELTHSLPPELLAGICAALQSEELPEGFPRPACDGRFEVGIRLVATGGDDVIAATSPLGLLYEDKDPNVNPRITGAEISVRGAPPFVLSPDVSTVVARDVEYRVAVAVDEDSAQTYDEIKNGEPAVDRENLTMTWFYDGGEMDKERSSFIEGTTDFENLGENFFLTPTRADYDRDQARVYFVLRDERGGMDWFSAELELVE